MLVTGHPRTICLSALLTAFALVGAGALAPAEGAPGDGGATAHVYPGAQPLSQGSAGVTAGSSEEQTGQGEAQTGQSETQTGQSETQTGQGETQTGQPQASSGPAFATAEQEEEAQAAQAQLLATQHYELAAHYFAKWELDLAEVEMDEAISLYPDFRIAHRDLCLISAAKLNFPRSLAEFMLVTGLTDPTPYSQADKTLLNNKAMHAHYKKALALGRDNKWTDSITELLWAKMYAPSDPSVLHSLAFAYASAGDFSNAEKEYKLTFSTSPDDGFAHADFANMLADHGQSAQAQAEMRKAVELAPNAAALHVDLGWLAESHKDLTTAETEFKAAVKLSPQHAGLWTHLARLMESQGETAQAQEAYQQALKLDRQNEEARASLDRLKQGKPSA